MLHLNRYLILTLHATVLQKESEHGPEQNITTHSQVAKTISLFSTIQITNKTFLYHIMTPKKITTETESNSTTTTVSARKDHLKEKIKETNRTIDGKN